MVWQDPYDLSLGVDSPAAVEPAGPTNLWEDFKHQFQSTFNYNELDSSTAFTSELYDRIHDNDQRISQMMPDYKPPIQDVTPEDLMVMSSQFTAQDMTPVYVTQSQRTAALAKYKIYEANMEELQKKFPAEVRTFSDMFNDVKAEREKAFQAVQDAGQGSGFAGTVGGFLGGAASQFDASRNPLQFASLFAGGFGKSVATRIATEAGVFGTGQVVQDALFTQPARQAFNEPDVNYGEDFLTAAAFGGLFRGVHEGAAPAFRALEDKIAPGRSFARALEEDIKSWHPTEDSFNLENPTGRAGAAIFDHDEALRAVNPYGDSDEGMARFVRDLDQMDQSYTTGEPLVDPNPREPGDIRSATVDRALLQAESPEVFARLTTAEAKLDELTGVSKTLSDSIDNRSVGDIASHFLDTDTTNLIKSLEDDMNDVKTKPEVRTAAEKQLNTIVESIGPDRFIQAANDSLIKPKYELRTARGAEKAARVEFNAAARDAFDELDRIKSRQEAVALAEHTGEIIKGSDLLSGIRGELVKANEKFKNIAKQLIENKNLTTEELNNLREQRSAIRDEIRSHELDLESATPLTREGTETAVKSTEEVSDALPKMVESIAEKEKIALAEPKGGEPKPTTFTLPNGDEVRLEFKIDDEGTPRTVRELLSSLQDEDAMLAAMKVCTL